MATRVGVEGDELTTAAVGGGGDARRAVESAGIGAGDIASQACSAGDNTSQAGCACEPSEEAAPEGEEEEGGGGGRHMPSSHASMMGPQGSCPPSMENHAAASVGSGVKLSTSPVDWSIYIYFYALFIGAIGRGVMYILLGLLLGVLICPVVGPRGR